MSQLRTTLLRAAHTLVSMINRAGTKALKPPFWLRRSVPAIDTLPALLGVEAYNYVLLLSWLPLDRRQRLQKIARFLCQSGLQDMGLSTYEALLATYNSPASAPAEHIAAYLQMLMFGSPEQFTDEYINKQHVKFSAHYASQHPFTTWDNPPLSGRRLKIGYTCHIITNSASTTLLQPLIANHNREKLEIFMYSDEANVPESVRSTVEHWRDTSAMGTESFCELVRQDGIDILLELNGHGIFNRYPVIARHPAPIQISWYNYGCTTGVPGMDYVLTSDDHEIEPLQPYYSEQIFRKKGTSHAMKIGPHFPPFETRAPVERNGFVTFCSFGQAHKVSRSQIHLWCEILKQVPGSRFFMKASSLSNPFSKAAFLHHFTTGGIDASRLILEGSSDHQTLLNRYASVDIALDTFPGNAGTTTVEGIIMGVPAISQTGPRYCNQFGRAILEAGGHSELLCHTPEEFISKAVALAQDTARIIQYRKTLREDFRHSQRCDIARFMRELEEAYTSLWERFENRAI